MKHLRFTFFVALALLTVLAACAPQSTPVVIVQTATTAPTDTPVPATPTEAPPTATLTPVPINLLPPMKVGSTFRYVDGSILVAVPNEGPVTVGKKGGTNNPETQLTLSDFWIYRAKVTNAEYALCVAAGQCAAPDPNDNPTYADVYHVNDPVVGVTWAQADAYCTFVHGHLPTEWQLEKTGRGVQANLYSWGNGAPTCNDLNFNNCVGKTTDVNTYGQSKSYYGALDMSGNAFEWASDNYDDLYYRSMPTQDPPGPDHGLTRAVRSTSYKSNADQVPLFVRFYDDPTHHRRDLSFRCVVDDPTYFAPACQTIAFVGMNAPGGGQAPVVVPTPACPNVDLNSAGFCNNNVPGGEPAANLHFLPNPLPALKPGMPVVPAGCSGGPNDYYCNGAGQASIQALCTVPPPPVPAGCSAGYTETPPGSGTCLWTGGNTDATQCLPGQTYDPVNQCCSSANGQGNSYQLCPSDAPYYSGGICVPWSSSDYGPLKHVDVVLGTCNHNPSGCPNAPKCSSPMVLDPSTCTCVYGYFCLSAGTQIDTPKGPVAVQDLHVGDLVWSASATGERFVATVLKVNRTPVSADHQMVRVRLADGRELYASLGHPTADGRTLGALKLGDVLDGARVVSVETGAYNQPATYDILPSGGTGYYWADGILIGSTLAAH